MSHAVARRSPHGQELPLLERRRAYVVHQIRRHPGDRYASDFQGASLKPEPGPDVSLMLAIDTEGGILTGEIRIPRELFDIGGIFKVLEAHGRVA